MTTTTTAKQRDQRYIPEREFICAIIDQASDDARAVIAKGFLQPDGTVTAPAICTNSRNKGDKWTAGEVIALVAFFRDTLPRVCELLPIHLPPCRIRTACGMGFLN